MRAPSQAGPLLAALLLGACAAGSGDGGAGGPDGGPGGGPGDDGGVGPDGGGPGPDADPADLVPYADLHFASTHNSYSGEARGSLREQLEGGVRVVEFDVHDNDFAGAGYRIGHDTPGHEVAHGDGNPGTDALTEWLGVIASWSEAHPDHAPVTILVDLKDSLDDNRSYAGGDLNRLGSLLEETFGPRLYRAEDAEGGALPAIGELHGRVLAVLSGHEGSRLGYRRDRGSDPAVAIDSSGRVIEVHHSVLGELWYWTGEIAPDGSVRWRRHARYDAGVDPAVALNEDGLVVEVHESQFVGDETMWYRVGELGDDFEIHWYHDGGLRFPDSDSGVNSSVRFLDPAGLEVREIHQSENTGDHWYWDGAFNPGTMRIEWSRDPADGGRTDAPLHDTSRAERGGLSVEVSRGPVGPYGGDTLRYRASGSNWRPIRYRQILFVEVQPGGSSALEADDLWFFAAAADSASGRSWAEGWRSAGRVVRLWGFNSVDQDTEPPVNFPATDMPAASWYLDHCLALDCRE